MTSQASNMHTCLNRREGTNFETSPKVFTSGKTPIALVKDGASRGIMLYGVSSPDKVASDFSILLNCNKAKQRNMNTKKIW